MTEGAQTAASKENNSLELLVEEKIVEVPDGAVISEWIRSNVRVVGEDVTVQETDLSVEGHPEFVMDLGILTRGRDTKKIVNVAGHKLKISYVKS